MKIVKALWLRFQYRRIQKSTLGYFPKTEFDIALLHQVNKNSKVLKSDFEKGFRELEPCMKVIENSIRHAQSNGFDEVKIIWNAMGYINLLCYDLKVVSYALVFEEKEWNKRYFSRQTCLIIYETLQNSPKVFDKDFFETINKLSNANEFLNDYKAVNEKLKNYKKKNLNKLNHIRNKVAAHIEKDCLDSISIISTINTSDVIIETMEFHNIMCELGACLTKVAITSSELAKK